MKTSIALLFLCVLLASCATQRKLDLPLHDEQFVLPSNVPTEYRDLYLEGYKEGWCDRLECFVKDIDYLDSDGGLHRFHVASISNYSSQGVYDAKIAVDQKVEDLIAKIGKEATKKLLAEIARKPKQD